MKVEYTYYSDEMALIISGKDFMLAFDNQDEAEALEFAVESFCNMCDCNSHFNDDLNDAIRKNINKSCEVIYLRRERRLGGRTVDVWCDVLIQDNGRPKAIAYSEDRGRNYILKR